jgi:hypothetical protein
MATLLGALTLGYLALTCSLAALKAFSFDELTTYNIARLPTAGAVWRGWVESGDGAPPVVHLATHLVGSALGFSHLTARLPAIVGFWVMCLGIFVFLRRRTDPFLAVTGMLMPATAPLAYSYAYEARSYGIVLGFAGAALVCWDGAREPRWRGVALVSLPVCLAAAVATHVYAVLMVVPLALAELARSFADRRADWWVWLGLAAPALVLWPTNPLFAHLRTSAELTRYALGPGVNLSALMQLWGQFLSVPVVYLGLLALVCLGRGLARGDAPGEPPQTARSTLADWVIATGLVALPAIGFLVANVLTGLLLFRYVLPAIIGFALLVPLLCRVALNRRVELALLAAGWVAVTAAGSTLGTRHAMRTTALTTQHVRDGRGCFALLNLWSGLPRDGSPIVVSDFSVYHQLHHYAPEPLRKRLVFLVDRQFGGLIEPYMPFYARVFGARMERFEEFVRSARSFYLYDCGSAGRLPLPAMLLRAGASLDDSGLGESADLLSRRDLYRVSLARDAAAGAPLR